MKKLIVAQNNLQINDPHICSDSNPRNNLVYSIYETLITRNDAGVFIPSLAKSWAVKLDDLTWEFVLRDDVKFHNGETLKASDVVSSLKRVVDPSIGGAYGTQGVYAAYIGEAELEARSDNIVTIKTVEPLADLLDLISEMPIGPESELDKLPKEYVGTGPYQLGESSTDEVSLYCFRDYWGGAPKIEELTWVAEPDSIARAQMVLDKEVDIGCMIGQEGLRVLEEGNGKVVRLGSGLCVIYMFNAFGGPCSDRRVRQALNYSLDIPEIIQNVKGGEAKQLNGYLTPHHFGYDPTTPQYNHDIDKAKNLLAEAGYKNGLNLVMDVPSSMPDEAPQLASIMVEQYRDVDIDMEIKLYDDRSAYAEMVRNKNIHDLCCFDSSPRSTFRVLREKIHSGYRGSWWEGYRNQEVDRLIWEAQRTFDDFARQQIYRRIYRIIRDDAPWVFLYRPTYHWAIGPRVTEWRPNADGLVNIK